MRGGYEYPAFGLRLVTGLVHTKGEKGEVCLMTLRDELLDDYWNEGFDAFFAGSDLKELDNLPDREAMLEWLDGWDAAKDYQDGLRVR